MNLFDKTLDEILKIDKEDIFKIPVEELEKIDYESLSKCITFLRCVRIRKRGFKSQKEYNEYLIKERGFKNSHEYHDHIAKRNGYEDIRDYSRKKYYKRGGLPLDKNKDCALYLGYHVAERVLSCVFENVQRMHVMNIGYDFICGKGHKIDVKSACFFRDGSWRFNIRKNKIADFFLIIAFDNRKDLNPLHIWLIKSDEIIKTERSMFRLNDKVSIFISNTDYGLKNYKKYEITDKLEKVIDICNELKERDGKYH